MAEVKKIATRESYGNALKELAAGGADNLDLGVKSVVEGQEDDTFPRDLPSAKGFIKLHKNHNSGFPFGFMKERPELVKGIPLMVISAMAGAACVRPG